MATVLTISAGSIPGRAHVLAGRNNQDAMAWAQGEHGFAAVVCDGCSEGNRSEVGAQLGAQLLVSSLLRSLDANLTPEHAVRRAGHALLRRLGALARTLAVPSVCAAEARRALRQVVGEQLLFTIVGVVGNRDVTQLFAAGDGLIVVDGERRRLGPFAGNAPPYLGYGLVDALARKALPESAITLFAPRSTGSWQSLVLATDGALALDDHGSDAPRLLDELVRDERLAHNRDLVRRRLTMAARAAGAHLDDDTTVLVLRREPARRSAEVTP